MSLGNSHDNSFMERQGPKEAVKTVTSRKGRLSGNYASCGHQIGGRCRHHGPCWQMLSATEAAEREQEHTLGCVQSLGIFLEWWQKSDSKVRRAVLGAVGRSRKGEEAYWVQQSSLPVLCSMSSFSWAGEQCDTRTLPKPRWYRKMTRVGAGAQGEEALEESGVTQSKKGGGKVTLSSVERSATKCTNQNTPAWWNSSLSL